MEAVSIQQLETLKYSELQKLAKKVGLKANLKADKLLKALKAHFHPETRADTSAQDSETNSSDADELNSSQEECQVTGSHVTHRRGKDQKTIQSEILLKLQDDDDVVNEPVINPLEIGHQQRDHAEEKAEVKRKSPFSETKQRKRSWTESEGDNQAASQSKKRSPSRSKSSAANGATPNGKIPRYAGSLSKPGSKPTTPNFKKLHEAHFKKMESIDKYMARKQKRLDAVGSSIQEMLAKKTNLLKLIEKTPVSSSKKTLKGRVSLKSPKPKAHEVSPACTPVNKRSSTRISTTNKSILVDRSVFKPSVFSSSKMNVRFSEATKDNEHKRSLIKTPSRKSSCFVAVTPSSDIRRSLSAIRKGDMNISAEKSSQQVITPFKFSAENTETPTTSKKSKFDLQASLARPLGYQPHKGKLKPWNDGKENSSGLKSNVSLLKSNYKQPLLQNRDDRRNQQEQGRRNKRNQTVGTRRGVLAK
ncbi:nucleolar and spindle-associated protein 1 isoform X2 [Bombina bombina]|uniref:nucleolar and spindle-associated protein 1 isoform X2 n=1 Tax=Bombina bombina TaxID=8345 RepID=UPI00235A5707|nr:nucleolar and spindle-associated protein 1 isoform X2 [Bombina bombina]